MEPLSVAASITGVLSAAGYVSKVIEKLKNAPKHIRDLNFEVKAIRAALEQVQALVVLGDQRHYHERGFLILIDHVMVVVTGLVLLFSDLESVVNGFSSEDKLGILDRAKWAIKEGTIKELEAKVLNSKASLTLMLTILQAQSQTEAMASVARLHELVEHLRDENWLIRRELADSQANLSIRETVKFEHAELAVPSYSSRHPRSFAFEEELYRSKPYKCSTRNDELDRITISKYSLRSMNFSATSGLSLSDVSHVAVLALPIDIQNISNKDRFPSSGKSLRYQRRQNAHIPGSKPELVDQHTVVSRLRTNSISLATQNLHVNATKHRVFGVLPEQSVRYAGVEVEVWQPFSNELIRGEIPYVLAKTLEVLSEKWSRTRSITDYYGTARQGSISRHVIGLHRSLDSPPCFGRDIDWAPYSGSDVAEVLRLYLCGLPELVLLYSHAKFFSIVSEDEEIGRFLLSSARPHPKYPVRLSAAGATKLEFCCQESFNRLPPLRLRMYLHILWTLFIHDLDTGIHVDGAIQILQPWLLVQSASDCIDRAHMIGHLILHFIFDKFKSASRPGAFSTKSLRQ